MEGVEILSQIPIYDSGSHGNMCVLICIMILSIIGFAVGSLDEGFFEGLAFAILGALLGSFIGAIIGTFVNAAMRQPTGEYTYKVTVDDTVKFNEFYDKYEIISQDGKIFEVKLRENYNG